MFGIRRFVAELYARRIGRIRRTIGTIAQAFITVAFAIRYNRNLVASGFFSRAGIQRSQSTM
jgi:hypothetical protein